MIVRPSKRWRKRLISAGDEEATCISSEGEELDSKDQSENIETGVWQYLDLAHCTNFSASSAYQFMYKMPQHKEWLESPCT